MALNYNETLKHRWWNCCGPSEYEVADKEEPRVELPSVKMDLLHRRSELNGEETPYEEWLSDNWQSKFENQEFSRIALISWLAAIGMPSVYSFKRKSYEGGRPTATWPWGAHTTEALGHLEAAARRFWVNYNPADPTTACTNDVVSEWLQNERNASKTLANAIASILRADGLNPGPRK